MAVNLAIFNDFIPVNGVRIGIASAGIKRAGRKDIVVFEVAESASIAGVFTTNAFCAAPVHISKANLANKPRYLMINTGNANAGTGERGMTDAQAVCQALAEKTGVTAQQILPFSTGVIGEPLPVAKITAVLDDALANLSADNWFAASNGIMTTDTQPKGASRQFQHEGVTYTISGISKGAGMIMPNMATMLGFIATDAAVEQAVLQQICRECADVSFNRITIDGDTSTNDSCMLIATGKAGNAIISQASGSLYEKLKAELKAVFIELAHAIVRDGEGATKFVTIKVEQTASQEEALQVAYTVAHSPLVKTALFASDANWGRILAAVGRAGVKNMVLEAIEIYLDDVCIVEKGGRAASYTEAQGAAVLKNAEFTIRICLGRGNVAETVWTTDLSHDYVTINADYRS